jgi:transposase InsO family protein
MELTMSQRHAVTKKMAAAYKRSTKPEKTRILDELVGLTNWHRDHARHALKEAASIKLVRPRRARPPTYGPLIDEALLHVWMLTRYPAGKRLAPMLSVLVPLLVRDRDLDLSASDATLLAAMSAASIERRLTPARARLGLKGRSHTKPGTLLKSQIPIRTWAEWSEDRPGFVEIDLVGHEGGNTAGEFCFTLTVTDIATGWTINRSVKNKAARWVVEAIDEVASRFPFPVLGIDSDNGAEFINTHLFEYCKEREITFTRSRSGNKNDGAHVEQKNWTHVRQLVGYLRFDSPEELALLNEIWALDGLFTNYLLAQQKLIFKQRHGARVTKRYDLAQTPHQRASTHAKTTELSHAAMASAFAGIHPAALHDQIQALSARLEDLSLTKGIAPIRKVNKAFSPSLHPGVLAEAMKLGSRRI